MSKPVDLFLSTHMLGAAYPPGPRQRPRRRLLQLRKDSKIARQQDHRRALRLEAAGHGSRPYRTTRPGPLQALNFEERLGLLVDKELAQGPLASQSILEVVGEPHRESDDHLRRVRVSAGRKH